MLYNTPPGVRRSVSHPGELKLAATLAAIVLLINLSLSAAQPELKARVEQFWSLWKQNKAEAAKLVSGDTRDLFLNAATPQYLGFKIETIELSEDGKTARVKVLAVRAIPNFPRPLEWPVVQNWTLIDGDWYLQYARPAAQELFPKSGGASVRRGQEGAKPSAVKFLTTEYNFGKVAEGTVVTRSFEFQNYGQKPVGIMSVLYARGVTGEFDPFYPPKPGQKKALELKFDTSGFSGFVEKKVRVLFHDSPIPVYLTLKGEIESPLPRTPNELNLGKVKRSEAIEKEVTITNKTGELIKLEIAGRGISDAPASLVGAIPAREILSARLTKDELKPGESTKLLVRIAPAELSPEERSYSDVIKIISPDQPGRAIYIPVEFEIVQ